MLSRFLTIPLCLALVAAALGGGWAVSRGAESRSHLTAALGALPASTVTVNFTDWTQISGSLDAASLRGLTTRSVLAPIDVQMRELLGWSVADLDWEANGLTEQGPVTAIGLGAVSASRAERSFAAIGSPVDGDPGTYRLDDDSGATSGFSSAFAWARVVEGSDVVLAAPDRASLDAADAVVDGRATSLLGVRAVVDLAGGLAGATTALVQQRALLCESSAIGPDDGTAVRQLSSALAGSDQLADPAWGARAVLDTDPQRVVFATAFGSDQVAREQFRVRQSLTRGPFIGRSGQVADSLRDLQASVAGGVVNLDFALTPEAEQFMSDTGPVVFAGCAP